MQNGAARERASRQSAQVEWRRELGPNAIRSDIARIYHAAGDRARF
jgi:hypothetical protein